MIIWTIFWTNFVQFRSSPAPRHVLPRVKSLFPALWPRRGSYQARSRVLMSCKHFGKFKWKKMMNKIKFDLYFGKRVAMNIRKWLLLLLLLSPKQNLIHQIYSIWVDVLLDYCLYLLRFIYLFIHNLNKSWSLQPGLGLWHSHSRSLVWKIIPTLAGILVFRVMPHFVSFL